MENELQNIDFHRYVDEELINKDFKCIPITEKLVRDRMNEIMEFYNSIMREYKDKYGWREENEDFFLNPLVDKWKFSFAILDNKDKFQFINFSSLYDKVIHFHFSYTRKESRGMDLAKYHALKICQTGLDNGLEMLEGYWPKNNNGSLILYLSLGFEIQSMRRERELFLSAQLEKVRNNSYNILIRKSAK